MSYHARFMGLVLITTILLAPCVSPPATPTAEAGLPNPASVYCEEGYSLGGKVQHVGEMVVASLHVP